MSQVLDRFLAAARAKKWRVEEHVSPPKLPPAFLRRYPRLPEDVVEFLSRVKRCSNPSDNVWLVTHADLTRPKGYKGFAADAFETMSLEAGGGGETREFWDRHCPVALSVGGDYAYAAVDVESGAIVYGEAPMFDEASRIAASFPEFLGDLEKAITKGPKDGLWALFV